MNAQVYKLVKLLGVIVGEKVHGCSEFNQGLCLGPRGWQCSAVLLQLLQGYDSDAGLGGGTL